MGIRTWGHSRKPGQWTAIALATFAATTCLAAPSFAKDPPPLSEQTKRSGGVVDPDQAKLSLDHVDLAIETMPDDKAIEGTATLSLTTAGDLSQVVLDLDPRFAIHSITINGNDIAKSAISNPEGKLRIALPTPAKKGDKIVAKVRYGGKPHVAIRAPWDDGFVWSGTVDRQHWYATTSQGYGCDLYWPCLDFPLGEAAMVDLHITVPKGLKAPANGILQKVDSLADGRTTWHWRARQPNNYGIALSIGPYEEVKGDYKSRFGNVIPMAYWYLPTKEKGVSEGEKARALFAEFAPTLDFFESVVGPYPWGDEKLGVVETPHLGMEHQTINAYGNNYAKAPNGFDWLFQHELSHEWFGNQMTVANWDDFWLHEGYGAYMQPLYGRWREGEARYAAMMETSRNGIANKAPLVSGKIRTEEEVYESNNGGPGGDIYVKGAWVLHTLRNLIGDDAFRDVTRLAVYGRTDPKPGNFKPRFASSDEYVGFVKQVTGKDYKWFFDVYLREAALPELTEQRSGDTLTLAWKTPANRPFPMPVEISVDGKIQKVDMSNGTATVKVPADAHILTDPYARILKRSIAVENYQAWLADAAKKKEAAEKAKAAEANSEKSSKKKKKK